MPDEEQDTWDSPLQWRQSIIQEMRQKDYAPTRSKTPVYLKQTEQHLITVPFNRCPSSSLHKLPPIEEKPRGRTASQSILQDNKLFKRSEVIIGSPAHKVIGKIKTPETPVIISPKKFHSPKRNIDTESAKLANQDFEFIRSPQINKLRKTPGNPIAELESKGRKNIDKTNEDEPPFNFQGMLRKTNYTRDSIKKNEENNKNEETPYMNVLKKSKPIDIFDQENEEVKEKWEEEGNKDIIRYEVAPGIFLEGKEAEV